MEKHPVVINPATMRGDKQRHRQQQQNGSSRSIKTSSSFLSLKGLLLDALNGTTSAGGGSSGGGGVTRKRAKKRIKIMAILWITGLLCWAGMSFFLPLVLIEFIYHDNHIDTTTSTTSGNMNSDKSRPDTAKTSLFSSSTNRHQHVGVHQLVQATKELHNQQQQQQQRSGDEAKQQQQQQSVPVVPVSLGSNVLARGIAGRPMQDTPALIGAQRAQVQCNIPVDDSLVAYWNDPVGIRDVHFNTIFNSQQEQQETQYITFSPDPGGWNNIRMSMEIVFVLAAITGRTLLLPASCNMYLLNKKKVAGGGGSPLVPRSFGDFFPLDKIRRWIPIISMQEFLLAQEGKLLPSPLSSSIRIDDVNQTVIVNRTILLESALHCENRKKADYSCFAIYELLNRVGYNPNVTDAKCVMFDEQAYGYSNNISNSNKNEPSAKAKELVKQICGKRPIVYWNRDMSAHHQLLYLPAFEKEYRLLTHFYGLLHASNATVENYMKRFVRDNLHYHDEIYCAAGKIVQALQKEGAALRIRRRNETIIHSDNNNSSGEGGAHYSALHVRRGDLQYKEVKIPASEWYSNTKELFRENELLYVATDERNKTFFDDLAKHYNLRFLDDYWDMAGLDQLDADYMGMVDTIVASRGRLFCGTWFSTFSGYINRLRGYHGMSMKESWYSFLPRKTALHEWTIVDKSTYAYEWPDGWIGIDADSFPQRDVF